MLKVLVADENLEANSNCCRHLANDTNLDIISVSSGITVLNKYYEVHPDVLVINSDFSDKTYCEIINELSSTAQERNKCNIILTIPNSRSRTELDYMSKVYKLFYLPLNCEKIKKGIEQYRLDKIVFYEVNDDNLRALFYELNLYNESLGAKYFKYAIKKCYDVPELSNSLNTIFELISKEFNVSVKSIRPAMRNALKTVNDFRDLNINNEFLKIFENESIITPKVFIRNITSYYIRQKNRRNR